MSYTVSHHAYVKTILHAAKHPHKQVNGVLLGKDVEGGAVTISDTIPLLHHWTSLSPSMEIGLDLARNHAQSLGLQLVGYYQASERPDDTTLAPVGERVAEILRRDFTRAIVFVVDGNKLGTTEPALIPFVPQGASSSWRPASSSVPPFSPSSSFQLESKSSPARALQLVRETNLHQKFGDFDDHLEDVSIDWLRNSECKDDIPI